MTLLLSMRVMVGALLWMAFLATQLPAQVADSSAGQPFSFERFRALVTANHPEADQARLVAAQGRSRLTEAWGAYDPKVALALSDKKYKASPYYRYVDASLTLPLPVGTGIKFGFERASGININPDRTTPAVGLFTLGVGLPLGQGILTDERRTSVVQARAERDVASADQIALINKLVISAAKAYGNWYGAWRRTGIATEGVRLAEFRVEAVRELVRAGSSAPVDTLEAVLETRRRTVTLLETQTELRTAALVVETFLWDARGRPLELPPESRPVLDGLDLVQTDTLRLRDWVRDAERRHPELLKADGKVRAASADRLLAAQGLLPDADGSLYAIAARNDMDLLTRRDEWSDNFKGSLGAATSLLLLKERGKLSGTGQKLDYARLDRDLVRRDVVYGVRIALNELTLIEQLLDVQRQNVGLATALRDAEQVRLLNGESNLLTINLRERLVLDEAVKLATLEGKLAAARATLAGAIGDVTVVR